MVRRAETLQNNLSHPTTSRHNKWFIGPFSQ